ncbi:MAG TPA: HAMP domain-containing sensor histidine kinase [Acidimicrobiales bacterium]|nr:HAMP domain-containing sensor histidine kinase [Acidimicrobiales bacterium]
MPERRGPRWVERLSLRLRLVLAAAIAVAVAVVLVAGGAYVLARHELYSQVDSSLRSDAASLNRTPLERGTRLGFSLQVLDPAGNVLFGGQLPVTSADRAVAAGDRSYAFHDTTVDGNHFRVYTIPVVGPEGASAAQLAVPLDAVDHTLSHLAAWLTLLGAVGIALAAVLGLLVARAALAPVNRLTSDAERVAATMDLSSTIEVEGADEIARLGQALNSLLAAIEQSQAAQRRLVADASHELRTPLTSMRTNLELLARSPDIPPEEQRAIINDLVAQAAELTTLVNQLVDLEREPLGAEQMVECQFDDVVEAALSRARLHSPSLEFVAHLEPTTVMGQPGVLERAVANLLDNAAKWSPPGGTIEVNLVGGTLSVRDHGPGIDPADAPHVFERFYRSARARQLPGSGLGLSIVRQAAETHGGQAWVLPAPGGGTIACLRIPVGAQQPPVVAVPYVGPPAEGPPPELPGYLGPAGSLGTSSSGPPSGPSNGHGGDAFVPPRSVVDTRNSAETAAENSPSVGNEDRAAGVPSAPPPGY